MSEHDSIRNRIREYLSKLTAPKVAGIGGLAILCSASLLAIAPATGEAGLVVMMNWLGSLGLNVLASVLKQEYQTLSTQPSLSEQERLVELAKGMTGRIKRQAELRREIGEFLGDGRLDAFRIAYEIANGNFKIHGWMILRIYEEITNFQAEFTEIHMAHARIISEIEELKRFKDRPIEPHFPDSITAATIEDVIASSAGRCCICYYVYGDKSDKDGKIAFLDGNSGNFGRDNLVYLCQDHHAKFDVHKGQLDGIAAEEIKKHRTSLEAKVWEAKSVPIGSPSEGLAENEAVHATFSRYLDSLDSARFSSSLVIEFSRLIRLLYVKAQFLLAMLSGGEIVVTENQLFDSLGFLETFSELQRAFSLQTGRKIPIKVALRNPEKSLFQVVADHLENINFKLTLWEDLSTSKPRRKIWADSIRRGERPPQESIHPPERDYIDRLFMAIMSLDSSHIIPALNIPDELVKRFNRIAELSEEEIDALQHQRFIQAIGTAQQHYLDEPEEIEAAKLLVSEIRRISTRIGPISTRSAAYDEIRKIQSRKVREGLYELTDCIYNQVLGIASTAHMIQNSTFGNQSNLFTHAGFALATYANVAQSGAVGTVFFPWEYISFDYLSELPHFADITKKQKFFDALSQITLNTPWSKVIRVHADPNCAELLRVYHGYLVSIQDVDKNLADSNDHHLHARLENEHFTLQNLLRISWADFIEAARPLIASDYWEVRVDQIQFHHPDYIEFPISIFYSPIKTKRDLTKDSDFSEWISRKMNKGRFDESNRSPIA